MPGIPYLIAQREAVDATTPRDFELAISEPDEMHLISRVVVTNLTTAYTSIQLMIGNFGNEQEIYYVGNPEVGERVVYDSAKIPVPPDMRLIARLVGLTDGDIFTISAIGILFAAGEITEAVVIIRGN